MKIKILVILTINLLLLPCVQIHAFAKEHTQMLGLFSMDIPQEWHWVENSEEVVITYPDRKSVAIEIQMEPSHEFSKADIKRLLKESDDKMIKEGIETHHGTLIADKEIKLDGVYATQLDFKTAPPNSIHVTYISFFNKGYVFTVTYGSEDEKMHSMMDDVLATFKFKTN